MKQADAAPSYGELQSAFPDGRVVYGPDGKRRGFKYPRHDDPERQRRVNEKVYELWNPNRKLDVENGARRNGAVHSVAMRDREGRKRLVPEQQAEMAGRRKGLLPVVRYGGARVRTGPDGVLWRDAGGGRWERTGHTHLGEPWDHQRASCPGCRAELAA